MSANYGIHMQKSLTHSGVVNSRGTLNSFLSRVWCIGQCKVEQYEALHSPPSASAQLNHCPVLCRTNPKHTVIRCLCAHILHFCQTDFTHSYLIEKNKKKEFLKCLLQSLVSQLSTQKELFSWWKLEVIFKTWKAEQSEGAQGWLIARTSLAIYHRTFFPTVH